MLSEEKNLLKKSVRKLTGKKNQMISFVDSEKVKILVFTFCDFALDEIGLHLGFVLT